MRRLETFLEIERIQKNASLEIFGDRWSLLIIRDMMFRDSGRTKNSWSRTKALPRISSRNRLQKLEASRIIRTIRDIEDKRKVIYKLKIS